MRTVDVGDAARRLGRLIEEVRESGKSVRITSLDGATAVLMSVDEFNSLHEAMISLAQRTTRDELAQADVDCVAGRAIRGDELRVRYGLPAM